MTERHGRPGSSGRWPIWCAGTLVLLCGLLSATMLRAQAQPSSGAPPQPALLEAGGPVPPPTAPAFFWVTETQAARTDMRLPPALPDLSVQWIERTPHYPRYCVDYVNGLPRLCGGTADQRHFPLPGEIVTFTARIANQGTVASPRSRARWHVTAASGPAAEGQAVEAPIPALAPGMTATLTYTWPWQTGPYTISLFLDPAGTIDEITRSNNLRDSRSDALYLDVLVHPLVDQAFAERPNLRGSWSFADWLQAQFEAMNNDLAASTYAAASSGVRDRVRLDVITVTQDVGGSLVAGSLDFDGRWTFRVADDDPDTPQNESQISAEQYAAAFAGTVDWGLVHELTHQIGAIDLYQLNVAASYQNPLPDADGRPLLLGFQWSHPGLMGGGDTGPHAWPAYSDHTTEGLNRNTGERRGYYGDYLFDVPAANSLRVLDNRGQALAGAGVTIYQTAGGSLQPAAVMSGTTGGDGRFNLPNRGLPYGGVTTATGHTLAANPFAAIDVVGFNGQLFVDIAQDGGHFYAWWPLSDFNLAFWQQSSLAYERSLPTHLPPAGAPAAPSNLSGRVDGQQVSLSWLPGPTPGLAGYQVWRGVEPAFYPFTLVATTTGTSLVDVITTTSRYAVTAVDAQGLQSGFSPLFRAPRLVLPVGVTVNAASGERLILDSHDGALVSQWPDDRWLGRQGSVHLGLTGGRDLQRDSDGRLLVAAAGENRIKVLDGELNLVNWFGSLDFAAGPLDNPAGLARVGSAFTVNQQPQPDAATLGLASFDSDLTLSGDVPLLAWQASLVAGRFGQAVRLGPQGRLLYAAQDRFAAAEGSLQLWVRPTWSWDDGVEHVFFEAVQEEPLPETAAVSGYRLRLAKASWNGLYAWLSDGDLGRHDVVLYADVSQWRPAEWHHLGVAWQALQPGTDYRRLTLWVDGVLQDSRVQRVPFRGSPTVLSVGSAPDGSAPAAADLDELLISRAARIGNSQDASILVSEAGGSRLDVLDWLGNSLVRFGGPGSGPGQFDDPRGLLVLPPDAGENLWPGIPLTRTVLVADRGNARIQVLAYDGASLSWQGQWQTDLLAPQGLAALPGNQILVSDAGDSKVKLLGQDGRLLVIWSGPNDGHTGPFRQPSGLAFLPDGDVLVADTGNSRVVRIAAVRATCGDFDHNGQVDAGDVQQIAEQWGAAYNPFYDIVADGVIDIADVMAIAASWGHVC